MVAPTALLRRLPHVLSPLPPPAEPPEHLRGRGPVVLVGGFCTTEEMLEPMRFWLHALGYRVLTHTVAAGMACGAASVVAVRETLRTAAELDEHGDGLRVVGYSRGGQIARIAVKDDDLRALVTLGAPFDLYRLRLPALLPAAAVAAAGTLGVPGLATLSCLFGSCCAEYRRGLRAPVRAPFTSIYSRTDGLVPWHGSRDRAARNVEVSGNHWELLSATPARTAVAEALAA